MKKLLSLLAILPAVAFAEPVSLLDTEGVSLSSDEWQAAPNENGGYDAVYRVDYVSPVSPVCGPSSTPALLAEVKGCGTLSFDWAFEDDGKGTTFRAEATVYDWIEDRWYDDWDEEWYDDSYWEYQRRVIDESGHCDIAVSGDARHQLRLSGTPRSWSGNGIHGRFVIRNVRWTPAPERIAVTFVANGGSTCEPAEYAPGATGGELPTPTREGYVFSGWYREDSLVRKIGRNDMLPFEPQLTLYAKWNLPLSLLNHDGLSFSCENGDASQWYAESMADKVGTFAALCDIRESSSAVLQVAGLSGAGTLSFDLFADGSANVELSYGNMVHDEEDEEYSWFETRGSQMFSVGSQLPRRTQRMHFDLPIAMAGDFLARWRLWGWGVDLTRMGVANVTWTPAPETITVKYDTDGGAALADGTFKPGTTYGDLAMPTRTGYAFVGWIDPAETNVNPLTEEPFIRMFGKSELLPFVEETRVKAYWGLPLDGFNTSGLVFANDGEFPWFVAEDVKGESGGPVARALVSKYDARLMTAVNGYGTLTFRYRTGDTYGWYDFTCNVDGSRTWSGITSLAFTDDEDGAGWLPGQVLVCGEGGHVIDWTVVNDSACAARTELCDVVWTPAPESMEVKFMTGKGTVGKTVTYVPGETFGRGEEELFEPAREGFAFGGWYLDPDFTRPVAAGDLVPFAADVKVYAKWWRTLASAETPLKLRNNSSAYEDAEPSASNEWNLVDSTYADGGDLLQVNFGEETGFAVLEATIAGPAFLDFTWNVMYEFGSGSLALTIDGKEAREFEMDLSAYLKGEGTQQSVRVVLDEGEHTVCWVADGWAGTIATVRDVTTSEITPAATIGEWLTRCRELRCWTPDNLPALASASAAAMKSTTPAVGYKAAVEHAFTTVLRLGEDELVTDVLKQFGFTTHWLNFGVTGSFDYSKPPVLNDVADEAFAKAEAAAETALADLDQIPPTWNGTVSLSSKEYPIDEDIAIDYGDVLYLKSMLKGVLGTAAWVKAYNVEMDWAKLEDDLAGVRIAEPSAEPALDGIANWGEPVNFVEGERVLWSLPPDADFVEESVLPKGNADTSGQFSTAWYGNKLYVRIAKGEFIADPEDANGNFEISIKLGNGSIQTPRSVSVQIVYAGSDWQTLQQMGIAYGPWYAADGDLWSGGTCYPVSYRENAADYVWIVDFGVRTGGTDGTVFDPTLRFIDRLDVSNNDNVWAEISGGAEEGEKRRASYDKGAKSLLAAANQRGAFDRVRDASALANSKTLVVEALKLAQSADAYILAKRTHSGTCLFNYDDVDEAKLQAMREHVATALASMDAPQAFDWRKGLTEEQKARYGYLDAPIGVWLGALFAGEISSGMIPPSASKDAYVPDFGRMASPTVGGLLPDMTREKWLEYAEAAGYAARCEVQPQRVTFDARGGVAKWTETEVLEGEAIGELPTAERLGYEFLGWFTAASGGERVTPKTVISAPLACYAQWEVADTVAKFVETDLAVDEGASLTVRVYGGNLFRSSSVKVYLAYKDATSDDLDLGKTKFPLTLSWKEGEVGEKTITLKAKKDSVAEGPETITLQLGDALGMKLDEIRTATVTIADAGTTSLKAKVVEPSKTKGVKKYEVSVLSSDEEDGIAVGSGTYYKGTKLTVKAQAKTGAAFAGWYDRGTGKKVSSDASYTFTVSKAVTLEARFSVRYNVRALADPADGATVTGGGWYAKNKTAKLKVTVKSHFKFLGWYAAKADDPNAPDMSKKLSTKTTYTTGKIKKDMTVFACCKSDPRLEILASSGGSVKGADKYAKGKTAKLTATPKKGYVFLGWYDADGKLLSQETTYKYKMGKEDVAFSAEFKKESKLATPTLDWNAATEFPVAVTYAAKPKVSGEVPVTIAKVSGLPKGLTYKGGKVSGLPTKAKAYTVSVKVALKSNAKKTWTLTQKLVVGKLPAWAAGTYDGGAGKTPAQVTLTVGSTGKVSGKLNFADAVWTLSGEGYAKLDAAKRTATLTLTAKKGSTKKTVKVTVGEDGLGGYAESATKGFVFEARQNLWKADAAWKAVAAALEGREIKDGDLTVRFGADGTVSAKLKVKKNTFSCSAVLCPTEFGESAVSGKLHLYFAPNTKKKFKGKVEVVDYASGPLAQP